jgi:hypothetical protein
MENPTLEDNNITHYEQFLNLGIKGNSKVRPRTGHEGPKGEQRNSSTLSLTSALDGGLVVNATPWLLYPQERNPVPII